MSKAGGKKITKLLSFVAKQVDLLVRFFDLWLNRVDGRWLFPRHSWIIAITGIIVLLAMTGGPDLLKSRGMYVWVVVGAAMMGLGAAIHVAAASNGKPLWRGGLDAPLRGWLLVPWLAWLGWVLVRFVFGEPPLYSEVGFGLLAIGAICGLIGAAATPQGGPVIAGWTLFMLAALAVWLIANKETTEYTGGAPYRHMMAPIGILTMYFALPFSRWWAWFVFRNRSEDFRKAFQPRLDDTQLFDPAFTSNAKFSEIIRAFFLAVVNTPFQLVLIPAMAIVIAPQHQVALYAVVGLVISWLLMAMVVFHPRLNALLGLINRLFVEGGSLIVSCFVVGFAAARVFGVSYATTVLDGTAGPTVVQYLLVLYSLSWIYDYWSMRSLIEIMLGFLHPTEETPKCVDYKHPSKKYPGRSQWLQAHGGLRIAVLRDTGDANVPFHFNIFRPLDLFREIAVRSPTSSDARKRIRLLESQVRFFRTFPALLFFAALFWCGGQLMGTPRNAHIETSTNPTPANQAFSLKRFHAGMSARTDEADPNPPVYFVAASGGGTRAAIHTMTVLKALDDNRVLHRVAGISSVSGGSLANAFFAHRRPDLVSLDAGVRDAAWEEFQTIVTDRHIQYVLNGAFEWRLVLGDRFGTILTESFDRRLPIQRKTLGECGDVAVIFNTTLVGEAPSRDATSNETTTVNSGSRVVFTNIASFTGDRAADADADAGYPEDLQYVCFGDPDIPLAATASASANFPPVFSNLAIDVKSGVQVSRRYWVTDGGATDNRGLISLLLALRSILEGWTDTDGELPPVRIVVADASAYGDTFAQDRGLSALGGARLHLSNKLIATLFSQVKALHEEKSKQKGKLTIHDLTLPKAIRSGMGTHWMMPTEVTFAPKKWIAGTTDPSKASLQEEQILPLFNQVFAENRAWPGDFNGEWVAEDDPREGLRSLLDADPPPQQ
jgi:hypothetical protein